MSNPEAEFDCLTVISNLSDITGGATDAEVTLFCYLACLLSIFDQKPSSAWGYRFVSTRSISPFSVDIAAGLDNLVANGSIQLAYEQYTITGAGQVELQLFTSLSRFESRAGWLQAACNSALAIPLSKVGASVVLEPELRRALALSSTRMLLGEDDGSPALYENFVQLAARIPEHAELFVVAVSWLASLSEHSDSPSLRVHGKAPADMT